MTQVIQKVARMLSDKIEVKRDRGNAGRKEIGTDGYEYHAGRYHLLSETDFAGILDVLYGNPFGICAMTVCMVIYGLSYWLGVKIVDIEV